MTHPSAADHPLSAITGSALGGVVRPDQGPAKDAEAFRRLLANLDPLLSGGGRSLAVVSALPEAGKSTVAAGLAFAAAASGRTTVLVDCDLRQPALAGRLGAVPGPGLAEVLQGNVELDAVMRRIEPPFGAGIGLPGAPPPPTPSLLVAGNDRLALLDRLEPDRLQRLLIGLGRRFEVVILDTAPVLGAAEALIVAAAADACVLCMRLGWTEHAAVERAQGTLQRVGATLAGTVLTGARASELATAGTRPARAPALP